MAKRDEGEIRIGDHATVLSGEHEGELVNVRTMGGGGIGCWLERDPHAGIVRLKRDQLRVVSTEEERWAARLLTSLGWTVEPPSTI